MADRLVIDTGPLVVLARSHLASLLEQLPFQFIAPRQVHEEFLAGSSRGHLEAWPGCVTVLELPSPLHPIASASLDDGEAAVIQLALEHEIAIVCIDDRKGRRAARAVGLSVTGSLGLLARAKVIGLVPAVRPLVDRITAEGAYFHPDLVRRVLADLGES
jgi:hypothetical protein